MLTNSELRARARKNLGGGIFQNVWLMTMVACLIIEVIYGVVSFTAFGVLLLTGPLEYGISRILTTTARGDGNVNFNSLFAGFKEDVSNTIILGLLREVFVFLWSLLLIIPGIIKAYAYSMSSFIQQDSEDKNWRSCLDRSIAVMDGKKWKLFCLDLSVIGWYLLGILCFGVGVLFVIPYHYQARAEFYEEIKVEMAKESNESKKTAD